MTRMREFHGTFVTPNSNKQVEGLVAGTISIVSSYNEESG